MRRIALPLVPLVLLAGCTFTTSVNRVADAPNVPRSSSAAVVPTPPHDAVLMGTVTVRGNRNKIGAACEAEAVDEARKLGATHVIMHTMDSSAARGVRCTAEAWYLGRIVNG